SSIRRHTRSKRDWSSDVCSSDLTKFQDLTFTCIMVLIFVYVMTFYNAGLESGVTFATFGYALTHMWVEVIGAFIAQRYIAAPIEIGRASCRGRVYVDAVVVYGAG